MRKIIKHQNSLLHPPIFELYECMSKALSFETAWSVRIITVWPKKTLAAVRAVDVLPLE
jgi:hypothetical protein